MQRFFDVAFISVIAKSWRDWCMNQKREKLKSVFIYVLYVEIKSVSERCRKDACLAVFLIFWKDTLTLWTLFTTNVKPLQPELFLSNRSYPLLGFYLFLFFLSFYQNMYWVLAFILSSWHFTINGMLIRLNWAVPLDYMTVCCLICSEWSVWDTLTTRRGSWARELSTSFLLKEMPHESPVRAQRGRRSYPRTQSSGR